MSSGNVQFSPGIGCHFKGAKAELFISSLLAQGTAFLVAVGNIISFLLFGVSRWFHSQFWLPFISQPLLSSYMIFFLRDSSNIQLLLAMCKAKSHNISYPNNAMFCFLVLADAIFSDPHLFRAAAQIFFLNCDLEHFAGSQLISLVALLFSIMSE